MKRGVTLLEVLFSIAVISIGLLAVLALFTLGTANIKKAQTANITANAGHAAVATFKVEGMHERQRWIQYVPGNGLAIIRPDFQSAGSPLFGTTLCIDPMGFSHNYEEDQPNGYANSPLWSVFPSVPAASVPGGGHMPRLTLHNGNVANPLPMTYLHAAKAFSVEDELIYNRPDNNALPAEQVFTIVSGKPGARQESGAWTWFATIQPTYGLNGANGECILSAAICRSRRSEGLHVPGTGGNEPHPWPEWTAQILPADFHSGGLNGGEVTIRTVPQFNAPERLDLRRDMWVLLSQRETLVCGTVQQTAWYRVSEIDEPVSSGNGWAIDASLIGADWKVLSTPVDVIINPSVAFIQDQTIYLVY